MIFFSFPPSYQRFKPTKHLNTFQSTIFPFRHSSLSIQNPLNICILWRTSFLPHHCFLRHPKRTINHFHFQLSRNNYLLLSRSLTSGLEPVSSWPPRRANKSSQALRCLQSSRDSRIKCFETREKLGSGKITLKEPSVFTGSSRRAVESLWALLAGLSASLGYAKVD